MRLAVIGVALLVIAGVFLASSVWTLPLVIVGVLMVLIAWIGSRLDGHFVIEWGGSGTKVEFRAEIKSPPPGHAPLLGSPVVARVRELDDREQVVEGEAHTVEIDIGELKALIAAAEAGEPNPPGAPTDSSSPSGTNGG